MPEIKQNQTPREYMEINGLQIRVGKFYNYNPSVEPDKMEMRILCPIGEDIVLFEALYDKIKEWLENV